MAIPVSMPYLSSSIPIYIGMEQGDKSIMYHVAVVVLGRGMTPQTLKLAPQNENP